MNPTTKQRDFLDFNRRLMKSETGGFQQFGLLLVILLLGALLSIFAGSHVEMIDGKKYLVHNFLNANVILQMMTDASFFAIMAVGVCLVIITTGIDLSVGSIFALSGVSMALALRAAGPMSPVVTVAFALVVSLGIGLLSGFVNGALVVGLNVHPFIITLGSMWVLRGIAFVISEAESILVPHQLTDVIKSSMGLTDTLHPVPMIVMIVIMILGALYLTRTVAGRHVFAVGGNVEASRFAGLKIKTVLITVYTITGLMAGLAAFLGVSYYGSASCGDATGYELYVIASAVVGGTSLSGGKGNIINVVLGAILIILIRQSIQTLHLNQNYEWIIIGTAVIIAVVLDQTSAKLSAKRMVQLAGDDAAASKK